MSVETTTALDIESLNKPDDSAHGLYNATTLKNADELDDDGHVKRTGKSLVHVSWSHLTTSLNLSADLRKGHVLRMHALQATGSQLVRTSSQLSLALVSFL